MAYYPDDWTDKELEALEKRIAEVYKQAERDLDKEVKEYFAKFKLRDKEMQALVDAGEITKAEHQQWRMTQIGRGQRFEALRDKMAERYTKANEVANAYVNDATPSIYSLNRNYEAYTIEKAVGSCDFTMWDEATVRRLLVEQPDVMPFYPEIRALRRGIDLEYGKSQITKYVTSGIIRGLPPGKIANELMASVTEMNRTSAVRAARTGITAAQNAGRMDSYVAAEKMGIQIRRKWACTKDARTRLDHGLADGQIVIGTKQPFVVGGYKMMFPGDKSMGAPGHEIYNCRCTTRTVEKDGIEAEPRQMRVKDPVTGESVLVNEMTYSEWVQWKETGKKPEPPISATPKKTSAMRRDPAKFRQRATESATNVETPEEYSKKIADKHGISIDISEAGKLTDEAKEQVAAIDKLLDEYNSTMVDYRLVKGGFYDKDGGQCYMKDGKSAVSVKTSTIKRNGSQDRLNLGDNSHLMTTYHEFAHSLSQSRENTDPDFWKDVKKVRTQYRKEIKGIDKAELVDRTINTSEAIAAKKKIFISDYAEKDIDEFLADAFAQAKLSSNPSPYAEEVLKTVDKYFKKPIESSSKRSIIKAEMTDTDRKAILDYMSAKSYSINEKLRTGKALDNQEQKFVDSLDAALKKAPKYSGNLSRSLIFDSSDDVSAFVKDYQPGNKVAYREFLSTTKGKTLYNPNGQVQIYIKDSKNGRDISLLNPREEEVLYERNASFKVENIVEQDGKYYILVVEDNE